MNTKYSMLVKAEKLSGNYSKMLKVTLSQGSILIGKSKGIEHEEDENGKDCYVLAFECLDLNRYCWLKDDQIKDVELAYM